MSTKLRTKLAVALAAAFLIAGVAFWRTYTSTEHLISTLEWADETGTVLAQVNVLLASIEHLESLQRAYLLTGEPGHLVDYRSAIGEVYREYEGLRALLDPTHAPYQRVLELRPMIETRISALSSVVEVYESAGLGAAQDRISEGPGMDLMSDIRSSLRGIADRERSVLAEQVAASRATTRATERALAASGLATLLLLVLGGVLTLLDLRRRERVEAELRQAKARADEAVQARTLFLATISHEIRTPLNAIIGMADLLRNSVVNSEQAEFTRAIYTNAEGLLHIINDLLDSSKIEAGQVDLEHIPLSIRDVLEGVGEILAVRAAAKDLELVTYVEPSVPRRLLGDPNRLWQVLMNLVGNAIKFTDEGEVSVRAATRTAEGDSERRELVVEVVDTGVGIPLEDQGRVLERFVQVDASTMRRFGGTGLGLSIANSLVMLMGGRLEIESVEGQGSTFRVVLPLEVPAGSEEGGTDALSGLRVLLAVPNERSRESLREVLHAAGATVEAAPEGSEIPGGAEEPWWDVVVAVQGRAGVDGAELAEAPARRGGKPAGLVYLVGVGAANFRRRPPPRLRVEYVFRPVKEGRLLEAVLAAAGRAPAGAPAGEGALPPAEGVMRYRPRVLVVEDNRDNWGLIVRVLSAASYDVDIAEDGKDAVERFRRSAYDLALMDIEMPVLDGFGATEQIRAIEEAEQRGRLPIVALTAHAVEGFRERCLASGMDDYATKPIRPQQLLEVVRKWVDPRPLVLVADDSTEGALVVRKFLEGEPVRLLSVANGKEALEAFQRHRVSVVLLDMDMPVMDGYSAARAIRQTPEGRSVPILAVTGYDGPEERRRCSEAGCTGHLAKPLRRAALVGAVRDALESVAGPVPPPPSALPPPSPTRAPRPGSVRPAGLEGGGATGIRELIARIRRLLERRRMAAAAEHVRALEYEISAPGTPENTPETLRVIGELLRAVEEESETSAAFWVDRLDDSLRELRRLDALRRTELLDAPPNEALDRLTRLAARVLNTPVSLVSLVDEQRQFFASQRGLGEPWASLRGTPLSHSFCKHVAYSGEPLVVEDARTNPLVSSNLAVPELDVIAYVGSPLITAEGDVLGSFCVIDNEPRAWTAEDLEIVGDLAALAVREMEGRRLPAPEPRVSGEGGDPDGVGSPAFTARFISARREDLQRARLLLSTGSFDEIARLGHQWKGSSATLGFPEVGKIGSELERAARGEDGVRVGVALDLLDEHLGRAAGDAPAPGGA